MSTELLRAENIVKTFGPTKALQGVDFTLYAGEIRGLIGENGSGKSTLCSICGGIYGCDSGELYLKGEPYHPTSMVDAQKKGFAQILQEMGTITPDAYFLAVDRMAEAALQDTCTACNPRVPTKEDIVKIYTRLWSN